MKQFIYTLSIALLLIISGQQAKGMTTQSKATQVSITNTTGKSCFFQPEGTPGYEQVTLDAKGKCSLNIQLASPAYYTYVDSKQGFNNIYLTPGSKTEITENGDGVSFKGDNEAINTFINKYRLLGRASQGKTMCSTEWQKVYTDELDSLRNKLNQSGLPDDFVKRHNLYYQFAYYTQFLNAPSMATMFMKMKLTLPDNYYAFLNTIQFDDPNIVTIPKWFATMNTAFSEMEKLGFIPADKDRFIQIYADKISNDKVRSAFLVELLNLTLQKGYSDDFSAYVESIRTSIKGSADLAALKEVEAKYATLKEAYKNILKGMPAPDFTAVDVNGKEYKMSDFAGKVVVLDFWFTGCIPCKAEMPFMEGIAESMEGDPIQFISMSLDTGDQLVEAWKAMVKDQKGPVLNLNVPLGFKSELAQKYGIRSVPRIVIVDKDGKIYSSNALRPSDPKLKQVLYTILGKGNPKEEIQKEMMALMQAPTAEEKDTILKGSIARFKKVPEVSPMLNMMLSQVILGYAKEKKHEQVDAYLAYINKGTSFRRDVAFLAGNRYIEEGVPDRAEPLIKEAAESTMEFQKTSTGDEDEIKKVSMISEVYGNLLVSLGRTQEAEQWIELAYGNGAKASFELMKSYATVQLSKKEYTKASPALERIFRKGMGSDALKAQLKEAYTGVNGSDKGFEKYVSELQKESADNQKEKILNQMISEKAPLFTLKNLRGEEVSLAALKGKVVILDFWATWCGPCKSSFPAMQKAANKYKSNKNVAFLFIDTWENAKDPQPAVKKFIDERGYDFNVLFDLKDPVSKKCEVIESYGAKGIPAKYIVDKEGNIRFKLVGFSGSDEQAVDELSTMIDILL